MAEKTINWVFRATDQTAAAFRSVETKVGGLARTFRSIAGFAGFAALTAGLRGIVSSLVEFGSELQDASEKLGVSAESLQVLKFAAEQTGASFDQLQQGLAFNTKLTLAAANGNKEAAATFAQLGIDAKAFSDLPIDRRLSVIAEQLSNTKDPALRLALTLKTLGRGGADLAPLLAQGAVGIETIKNKLEESNSVLSNDQVKALDDAGDAWEEFVLILKAKAAPALTGTIDFLKEAGKYMKALLNDQLYLTNSGFAIRDDSTKGPINGRGRKPSALSKDEQATIIGEAKADPTTTAIAKAAKESNTEVETLTKNIEKLSTEANRYFDERGADLTARFKPALNILQDEIAEVNSLFLAGTITLQTANDAVQAYADTYAASLDVVKDKNIEIKDDVEDMFDSLKISADGFARDLTDTFFDATNSIGDLFKQLAVTIAKALFTQSVSEPLIAGILNSFSFGGGKAVGGPVSKGTSYLVGENGPELFVPNSSGSIVPNGGAGGSPIQINFSINSIDPQTAAQTIAANERLITGMIRRASVRAGARPQLA